MNVDGTSETRSIGGFLRHEREVRQMSLEELSLVTRIPLRQLELTERRAVEGGCDLSHADSGAIAHIPIGNGICQRGTIVQDY